MEESPKMTPTEANDLAGQLSWLLVHRKLSSKVYKKVDKLASLLFEYANEETVRGEGGYGSTGR